MPLLQKSDVVELTCKFKGHVAKDQILKKLVETRESQDTECDRCGFGINLRIDSDDDQYYILSEL